MIVTNETRIIGRCLHAVAPYLDGYAICDTGSTDGTQRRTHAVMAEFDVPSEVRLIPFHSFQQARYAALASARENWSGDKFLLGPQQTLAEIAAPERNPCVELRWTVLVPW